MTTKMNNKERLAVRRLKQDYMRIIKDPVPYVLAHPLPQNILEWHYAILGPEDTPYEGGVYHGKLIFPSEFPFKPPSIYILTPNGRFRTNTRLCLSISDFHPDTWNPAWSAATILTGLLSFMVETAPTMGSIETSVFEKKQHAQRSLSYNSKDPIFCDLFPDMIKDFKTRELQEKERLQQLEKRQLINGIPANSHSTNFDGLAAENREGPHQPALGPTLTNLIVIIGFAAFAFSVKYVLGNIA